MGSGVGQPDTGKGGGGRDEPCPLGVKVAKMMVVIKYLARP